MTSTSVAKTTVIGDIVKILDNNKAYAAFLAPVIVALGAAVASWIATGDFNDAEIRTALSGAVLAVVSSIATWLQPATAAEVKVNPGTADVDPVAPPGVR